MYIVTGVGGYVSSRVAEALLRSEPAESIIVTTRSADTAATWRARGVDARIADYNDSGSLRRGFEGGRSLFMISGMEAGPRRQRQHGDVVDAAAAAGVEHLVYTSFLGADHPGASSVEVADHQFTEQRVRESGMRWNFMRNSQYADAMAENQAAISIASGVSAGNTGEGRVSFVCRDDVAEVGAALLRGAGEPNTGYDVTGPEAFTYREVGEMISALSGASIEMRDLSDDEMYALWDGLGVPRSADGDFSASPVPWASDGMVTLGRMIREGHCANVTDVVERFTGRPGRSLEDLMRAAQPGWPAPGGVTA
ncbi:NAD(P)H-binding protein [Leucobacter triazinivorans]|uniref:NAD(P)H-binding protein n=1 Tax=Leucobacter triazinivorans TaxID=1784719 RepID=UPI0013EE6BC8|nr:NAD(P)H-binding protein [Leucobacter triazinivorans]